MNSLLFTKSVDGNQKLFFVATCRTGENTTGGVRYGAPALEPTGITYWHGECIGGYLIGNKLHAYRCGCIGSEYSKHH